MDLIYPYPPLFRVILIFGSGYYWIWFFFKYFSSSYCIKYTDLNSLYVTYFQSDSLSWNLNNWDLIMPWYWFCHFLLMDIVLDIIVILFVVFSHVCNHVNCDFLLFICLHTFKNIFSLTKIHHHQFHFHHLTALKT